MPKHTAADGQRKHSGIAQFVGTNLGHQAKNGTNGHPGRTDFFQDTSLKIRTVPENPGWMVTLCYIAVNALCLLDKVNTHNK